MIESEHSILSINFNQDQGCFACSTERGFKIFNTYPLKDTFQRDFDGGLGKVEMLFRSNILALIGGGHCPKYPLNKVTLWDDHQMKSIGELSFKDNVVGVKLRRDLIVVALKNKIFIYNLDDLTLIDTFETIENPKGLCALNPVNSPILVCPGPKDKKGHFQIRTIGGEQNDIVQKAHESNLASLVMSLDGSLIATASDKGTIIRIFSTLDGQLVQELRRGADKAEIFSLCFGKGNKWIACSSDKGTVHVYALKESLSQEFDSAAVRIDEPIPLDASSSGRELTQSYVPQDFSKKEKAIKNPKSMFSFMKKVVPYFDSEWSFAQFRIPDAKTVCAFGPADKDFLIIVSTEGNYYVAEINTKNGGDCTKLQEKRLIID